MDLRIAARNVGYTLLALAAVTYLSILVYLTFTAQTAQVWTVVPRAWNTWWTYAQQTSNVVMPVLTAVIAQFVNTARAWIRTQGK